MTMSIQGEWVQNECVIRETGKKIVERDKGNSSNRQFVVWFCHFFGMIGEFVYPVWGC